MKDLPIILLHGWGFSGRIWQPLIRALHDAGNTQVFAIDLPGFGSAKNVILLYLFGGRQLARHAR